jgi:hypothetical protein
MGLITNFLINSYDLTFGIAIPIALVMSITEYLWSLEKRIGTTEASARRTKSASEGHGSVTTEGGAGPKDVVASAKGFRPRARTYGHEAQRAPAQLEQSSKPELVKKNVSCAEDEDEN